MIILDKKKLTTFLENYEFLKTDRRNADYDDTYDDIEDDESDEFGGMSYSRFSHDEYWD